MTNAFVQAQNAYETPELEIDIALFKARRASALFIAAGQDLGWGNFVKGTIETHEFDCDHFTMMAEPTIATIGAKLNQKLILSKPGGSDDEEHAA